MVDWLTLPEWSSYVVGAGIGLLSCLTFLLSDEPLGCSTAFARTSGMIERLFGGAKACEKAYYRKFAPVIDWQWMLVLGVVLGAFLSAWISDDFKPTWVPARWAAVFGTAWLPRVTAAFGGGVLMGFGARWAGGCTSGHGISGTLQLAASGWVAVACFFIGGVAVAMLVFRVLGA
ncbi:MAG: YeeE/YedE family protein [Kiritimatiellae bacterium]|nr:YeeE/YedE family protein [Kiritimatiellia bacterium]